jgi:hypothetical protein
MLRHPLAWAADLRVGSRCGGVELLNGSPICRSRAGAA